MDEYSRILIEQYCATHPRTVKARRLSRLLALSYDPGTEVSDDDALWLERAIDRERDPALKEALEDLDQYLFRW